MLSVNLRASLYGRNNFKKARVISGFFHCLILLLKKREENESFKLKMYKRTY
nr:MAG TPA: hypothetical protein [Bacteriophage sp.]